MSRARFRAWRHAMVRGASIVVRSDDISSPWAGNDQRMSLRGRVPSYARHDDGRYVKKACCAEHWHDSRKRRVSFWAHPADQSCAIQPRMRFPTSASRVAAQGPPRARALHGRQTQKQGISCKFLARAYLCIYTRGANDARCGGVK
jgi:hypothetical protein